MTETPVSEGVKRIVDFISANLKCNRRKLVEALAPSAAPALVETLAAGGQPALQAESAQPTPEQTAVIADLHWLIHQGHVIEFANGILETAKKPLPKPPKPEAKPVEKRADPAPQAEVVPAAEPVAAEPVGAADAPLPEAAIPAEEVPTVDPHPTEVSSSMSEASSVTAAEAVVTPESAPTERPL